jgi:putative ABC transport system ATP-binding protein
MPEREPIVALRSVEKTYRQGDQHVRAVAGVTLEVGKEEFLSIMGPSGSGKSTLLHLIGGLDVPDSGEILVNGRRFAALTDDELTLFRRRAIGIVFQFFHLMPTLTAAENVALPLMLDGLSRRDIKLRAERSLGRVGLSPRAHHRPDQLSGGEKQRVAIARALVIEPVVLLADEPTGALDSGTGDEILKLIGELRAHLGLTILLVTHDGRAAAHGDRIVTLKDGKVIGDDRQDVS